MPPTTLNSEEPLKPYQPTFKSQKSNQLLPYSEYRNAAALPRNSGGCGGILVYSSWPPGGVRGIQQTMCSGGSLHTSSAPTQGTRPRRARAP